MSDRKLTTSGDVERKESSKPVPEIGKEENIVESVAENLTKLALAEAAAVSGTTSLPPAKAESVKIHKTVGMLKKRKSEPSPSEHKSPKSTVTRKPISSRSSDELQKLKLKRTVSKKDESSSETVTNPAEKQSRTFPVKKEEERGAIPKTFKTDRSATKLAETKLTQRTKTASEKKPALSKSMGRTLDEKVKSSDKLEKQKSTPKVNVKRDLGAVLRARGPPVVFDNEDIGPKRFEDVGENSSKDDPLDIKDLGKVITTSQIGLRKGIETGVLRTPRGATGISQPTPERSEMPPPSELQLLCRDFLDYRRTALNSLKSKESDMRVTYPKVETLLNQARAVSLIISRIPEEVPEDETELRIQNDRLNYLITTSSSIFKRVNERFSNFRKEVNDYTEYTTEVNEGITKRLEMVMEKVCEKAGYDGK